jgi:hypothetical protein
MLARQAAVEYGERARARRRTWRPAALPASQDAAYVTRPVWADGAALSGIHGSEPTPGALGR